MMDSSIDAIVARMKTIAIVGLSKDPSKYSYTVGEYLREKGFEVIPVNPTADKIMGLKSYPSLAFIPDDINRRIDVVDIFRRSEEVLTIVEEVIQLKRFTKKHLAVWMQQGIINEEAAKRAREAGLDVVMDACISAEHRKRA